MPDIGTPRPCNSITLTAERQRVVGRASSRSPVTPFSDRPSPTRPPAADRHAEVGWRSLDFGWHETKQVPWNRAIPKCGPGNPRYHFPIVIRCTRDRRAERVAQGSGLEVGHGAGRLSEQAPFHQRSTPSARTVTSGTARDSILANFERPPPPSSPRGQVPVAFLQLSGRLDASIQINWVERFFAQPGYAS